MSESAARADRFGVPPAASAPSYNWEISSKPVAVRISLDLVDRLEKEVVDSFRSLSSRGSEIGGLLLGTVQSGSPARVSIESFELVTCDYARGPLYQFSEADTGRFERAVEQRNAAGGLRVVGFFRSHTRKGLGLDAEDTAFLTGHFRDPQQVALLIRPYASKPCTGGFFIWENGTIRGEASYQEFPFRRSELERMPQPESKPASEKTPVSEPGLASDSAPAKPSVRAQIVPIASRREISMPPPLPPERPAAKTELPDEPVAPPRFADRSATPEPKQKIDEPSAPLFAKSPAFSKPASPAEDEKRDTPLADLVLPPLERPRHSKMIWITAGSAAVLLLLSGALIYPGFSHKGKRSAIPGQDASALTLRVERSAGELLLTWNRDSEAIRTAARAILTITDGDQHENVNLDLAQLRNGSVVYSPTGSDVSFQLSIIGQNSAQTNSESVRILRTRPSPMAENTPQAQPQKAAAAPARPEANTATQPANAPPAPNASTPPPAAAPGPVTVADSTPPKAVATPLKEFHAESLSQRLRPTRPTDLPEAPGLSASAAPAALSIPGLNTAPGMPAVAPPPGAPQTAVSPKTGGQVQQAQLVSSVPPEYPLVAKNAHQQGVVVVSATIGVDGHVKSATAVSGPGLLQKPAVNAVKQWIYRPTTLNGAPVESETRVEVRFQAGR